ncbi:hypothetical protein A3J19_02500 [Candidatus Daviesbacteria bacterium RIFCSPLOWO2_02_FULL_41_8]|uniref:Uncharacterized protein n=2 Tax=Candidatus Daviesiibacteriota TaxID=1752718 RepID=A0A1F5NGG4_9BACT|nr:MAG: hypothetical protein A2871_02200 [Candidatus Daviesbacteria bacterium RIFCSPHIGHO2_01_FULL_41_23]OGE76718.1 MAG: hypothetical protein A3J19_02500 [Candidatus Daviesbacteria bacterium RIFCSPLOWO2_02_FULL_41_8]
MAKLSPEIGGGRSQHYTYDSQKAPQGAGDEIPLGSEPLITTERVRPRRKRPLITSERVRTRRKHPLLNAMLRLSLTAMVMAAGIGFSGKAEIASADSPRQGAEWTFNPDIFGDLTLPKQEAEDPNNSQNIQASTTIVDSNGNVRFLFAVNNSLFGAVSNFDKTIVYESVCAAPDKLCTEAKPIFKADGQNIRAILVPQGRPNEMVLVGETRLRWADPLVDQCFKSVQSPPSWSCQKAAVPAGIRGVATEVLEASNGIIANIGGSEGSSGRVYFERDPITGILKPGVGIIDTRTGTYLRATSLPQLVDSNNPDITQDISLASGRGAPGIDFITSDPKAGTGQMDTYYASYLGFLYGGARYTKAGESLMEVNNTTYQLLTTVGLDSSGRPSAIKAPSQYYGDWRDQGGILNYSWGYNLNMSQLWVGVNSQGQVHNWYSMGAIVNDKSVIGVGHLQKGADPKTDLFFRQFGPSNIDVTTKTGSIQNSMRFFPFRGQPGLLDPLVNNDSNGTKPGKLGTLVWYPLNKDYSPNPTAEPIYIGKGLGKPLTEPTPTPTSNNTAIYLPSVTRQFSSGW